MLSQTHTPQLSLGRVSTGIIGGLLILCGITDRAHGDVIAAWTFPTDTSIAFSNSAFVSDPYLANAGVGTLTVRKPTTTYHSSNVGSGNSTVPAVNDGTGTLRANAFVATTLYLDFEFSTLGASGISISLDGTKAGFDPSASMGGVLSLDGGLTFVPGVGIGVNRDSGWRRSTLDLSAHDQFNNQSSVLLRLGGKADGFRDLRLAIDNVTVSATDTVTAPEPASWPLVLIALAAVTLIQRVRTHVRG
jgi:hypothetical protein